MEGPVVEKICGRKKREKKNPILGKVLALDVHGKEKAL